MAASDPSPGRASDSSGGSGSQGPAGGSRGAAVGATVAARVAEEQAQRYLEDAKRQADELVRSRVELVRELTDELLEQRRRPAASSTPCSPGWTGPTSGSRRRRSRRPRPRGRPGASGAAPIPIARHRFGRSPTSPRRRPRPATGRTAAAREAALNPDAARLLAIEVSGHTRDEVDAHLREAFRVTETAQLLDDVFGPGSGESRGGWTGR